MLCAVYSSLIYQILWVCTVRLFVKQVRLFVKQPLYLPVEHSIRFHSSVKLIDVITNSLKHSSHYD